MSDKQAAVRGDTSKVGGEFKKALGVADISVNLEKVIAHAAVVASCMMDLRYMEDLQWEKQVASQFVGYFDKEACSKASEAVREEAEKMLIVPDEDEDDEDAEELCNCMFTLAYGTKILLHNTKMKLLRGRRYGLLGGNDSGKTTLMRAISKNQVEGFPDSADVRTVFVEADIQGEQSHLSCVDYICIDPKIEALGISNDEVRAVMAHQHRGRRAARAE